MVEYARCDRAGNRPSYTVWEEDGTHDVTVFFPVIFPDGATGSELSDLPEECHAVVDGEINAVDCTGNIVLDDSANLYKGELNDWFYFPDELTVTFTVVTGEGENRLRRNAAGCAGGILPATRTFYTACADVG